jgi:hypothetical protein
MPCPAPRAAHGFSMMHRQYAARKEGRDIEPPRAAFRGACPERSVGAALARGYSRCALSGLFS